ncbi:MAG: tRNA 2-thiouridine(34) synthase MnmA [Rhizomicrobium sp.]
MAGTYTPQMHLPRDSNRNTRVVVAMSGGVDSSVTAALMARQGYDIVGLTLQLYDHGTAIRKKGACCAGQDIHDAKRVAAQLGIPHYVLDYEERFRKAVIADFAASYARGETPIPCVRCNERVKFADLLAVAQDLGASALATGHYVRRVESSEGPQLHMAADASRDQSYFLFRTTREQLSFLRFPLGELQKSEVRRLATELGLIVAEKPDSQDICFVPNGDYATVIRRIDDRSSAPGEIVDLNGNVLGMHRGIVHFTVGQRKGLGLSGNSEPLFVLHIDAPRRRVIVGPREALRVRSIRLKEVNWLASVSEPLDCIVKVRSTRPSIEARVTPGPDGGAVVELPVGEEAVAPGQACVFYETGGSRILGGGWIATSGISRAAA